MDIKEIERAMHTLACGDTNFETVSRLASLVIVRDHLATLTAPPAERLEERTSTAAFSPSGSEFMDAVAAAPIDGVMRVLDEHMEALAVTIPAEYDVVMRKLRRLIL